MRKEVLRGAHSRRPQQGLGRRSRGTVPSSSMRTTWITNTPKSQTVSVSIYIGASTSTSIPSSSDRDHLRDRGLPMRGRPKTSSPTRRTTDDDNVSAELAVKVKRMTKKKAPQKPKAATKGKGKVSAKGGRRRRRRRRRSGDPAHSSHCRLSCTQRFRRRRRWLPLPRYIDTRWTTPILLGKVASKMALPIHCIMLGYESPWSSKVGQKRRSNLHRFRIQSRLSSGRRASNTLRGKKEERSQGLR